MKHLTIELTCTLTRLMHISLQKPHAVQVHVFVLVVRRLNYGYFIIICIALRGTCHDKMHSGLSNSHHSYVCAMYLYIHMQRE